MTSNRGIIRLRKCKVRGCKRLAKIEDYWYCREHRAWMRQTKEYVVFGA